MTATIPVVAEKRQYRFDGFLVDPVRRRLVRDGETLPVTPKALSILLVLIEHRGEVVDKEELLRRIWPETFVTEANLTQNVSALRKALGERANEHRYVVTVPGRGYSFVAEVNEVHVPSSQADVPTSTVPSVAQAAPESAPARPLGRQILESAAVLVLLVAVAVLGVAVLRGRTAPAAASKAAGSAEERRPSIAVLGFKNLSGAPSAQWLEPALAEMLTTELAAGGRVRVATRENVARARQVASSESLDAASLRRLHGILGCDLLLVGSFTPLGDEAGGLIRLDLRVLKLPGGDPAASLAEVGTEPELFELVARTGGRLRHSLGLAGLSPAEARTARALQPASSEAVRLYSTGLERLRAFHSSQALDLLRRAATKDPRSAAIRSALSQAWAALGYDARAREEAARAVALAGSLPRPERLAIEARAHQVSRQWARASEIYRTLWTFYPDDLEHGLLLAESQSEGGRDTDALSTVAELRKLPPPAGQDPRIDLAEAVAAMRLLESARMLRAARQAEQKGRASGEAVIVAQALFTQGAGRLVGGDPAEAIRLFQQARTAYQQAGNSLEMAASMALIGLARQKQGDLAGAEKIHLEAFQILEKLGNVSGIAVQLGNLGLLYQSQGDLKRALDFLDRSRARLTEIDDPLLEARILNASSSILYAQGDFEGARSRIEEVLALSRKVKSRNDEARAKVNLAAILVLKGEIREASRLAREAFEILRESDPAQAASALAAWADTLARQGDLAGARQRFEQGLEMKRKAGDRIGTGQLLGALAYLEHRAGNPAAARTHSREQLRIAQETGARTLRAWAWQGQGRAELAAGDLSAARKSLERALAESSAVGDSSRAMAVRLDLARLAQAAGKAGEAAGLAGETAAWYRERDSAWGEALSLSVQAEALADQGHGEEARAAGTRIRVLIQRGEDRDLFLAVAPGLARAEAAGGDADRALRTLDQAAGEAGGRGFVLAALEARRTADEVRAERVPSR
ncbi:MAG TPA: tetratricopeptide repeat protein [Thermoanaerobaculia bacterium]|nr:tetratricopeptide repeat protein [Thermoanaerobaculia bacterium]